ncbi:hypothetical protein CSPX01_16349 [Colletotrichum filicis]|nr:hypothetical protein CSPX01_16349 [Colletotrichum filicis]
MTCLLGLYLSLLLSPTSIVPVAIFFRASLCERKAASRWHSVP